MRSDEEIAALFNGFDMVEPGLATVVSWGVEGTPEETLVRISAGVGYKA